MLFLVKRSNRPLSQSPMLNWRNRSDSDTQINQRFALFQKDLEELTTLQKLPQLICLTNDGDLSDAVTQFYEQLK